MNTEIAIMFIIRMARILNFDDFDTSAFRSGFILLSYDGSL